jgi:hypothetical protein
VVKPRHQGLGGVEASVPDAAGPVLVRSGRVLVRSDDSLRCCAQSASSALTGAGSTTWGRSWAVPAKVHPVRPPVEGSQVRAAGLIRRTPSGPIESLPQVVLHSLGARQVCRVCSGHCNLITGRALRDECLTAGAWPHRPVRGSPKQYQHGGRRWCRQRRWPWSYLPRSAAGAGRSSSISCR